MIILFVENYRIQYFPTSALTRLKVTTVNLLAHSELKFLPLTTQYTVGCSTQYRIVISEAVPSIYTVY